MGIIALNPDFRRLNKYFYYWMPKKLYVKTHDMSVLESETGKMSPVPYSSHIPGPSKFCTPSYKSYIRREYKDLATKAQSVLTHIDLTVYSDLCETNDLQDFYDDILFVTTEFENKIPDFLSSLKLSIKQNPLLNYYQTLRFLKILFSKLNDNMELIIEGRHKIINESQRMSIDNPKTIFEILKAIENITYKRTLHSTEFKNPDTKDDTFPSLSDLPLEYIENKLQERRPRQGRQRGLNNYTASFMIRLLDYLNHETNLTAGDATIISSRQARFLFDLMSLIGLFENEKRTIIYPEDYIRAILTNYLKFRKNWLSAQ